MRAPAKLYLEDLTMTFQTVSKHTPRIKKTLVPIMIPGKTQSHNPLEPGCGHTSRHGNL